MIMTKESHPKLFERLRAIRLAKKQITEMYERYRKFLTPKQDARNRKLMELALKNIDIDIKVKPRYANKKRG